MLFNISWTLDRREWHQPAFLLLLASLFPLRFLLLQVRCQSHLYEFNWWDFFLLLCYCFSLSLSLPSRSSVYVISIFMMLFFLPPADRSLPVLTSFSEELRLDRVNYKLSFSLPFTFHLSPQHDMHVLDGCRFCEWEPEKSDCCSLCWLHNRSKLQYWTQIDTINHTIDLSMLKNNWIIHLVLWMNGSWKCLITLALMEAMSLVPMAEWVTLWAGRWFPEL